MGLFCCDIDRRIIILSKDKVTTGTTKRMNLWDDGVKYAICWALFLISTKEKSILFGIFGIIMICYCIYYESKNIIKYFPEYKWGQRYIYIKSIILILILVMNMDLRGKNVFVIVSFINVYLMIVSIVGSLVWNENVYFDDKANNFGTLFVTKNGEYSRTIYAARELGLRLPFSNKYVSVRENLIYLDKLANKITNFNIAKLEKIKLMLSVDSKENKLIAFMRNCFWFVVILIITGKASIQLGAVSGIDIGITIQNRMPLIIALFLSLLVFLPLIVKTYRSAQIAKDRRLLLIVVERAIQIIKAE